MKSICKQEGNLQSIYIENDTDNPVAVKEYIISNKEESVESVNEIICLREVQALQLLRITDNQNS